MTNDIFTKKTPLVLAVGAALSLGVQTAWAADEEPTHHALTLGDGKNNTFHSVIDSEESSITLPDDFQDYFNDQAQDDDGKWAKGDVIDVKGVTGTSTIDSVTIKTNGSLTIGSNVGALVFDKATVKNINIEGGTFSNGSVTYLEGASLTATGGTFKNTGTLKVGIDYVPVTSGDDAAGEEEVTLNGDSLTMKVGGTTAFTNEKGATIELGEGVSFTVGFDKPVVPEGSGDSDGNTDEEATVGSFTNSGTIKVGAKGTLTISDRDVNSTEASSDTPDYTDTAPDGLVTIKMGNIEVAKGGKIVNNNTGYTVTTTEEAEDDEEPTKTTKSYGLVTFGTVTLVGATFENAAKARDEGTKLSLTEDSTATIAGTSTWTDVLVSDKATVNGSKISVKSGGTLSIGTLTLANLAANRDDLTSIFNDGDDANTADPVGKIVITSGIAVVDLRGDSARTFEVNPTEKIDGIELDTTSSTLSLSISNSINYATDKRQHFTWEELQKNETEDGAGESVTETSEAPTSDRNLFEAVTEGDVATLKVTGYKATWEEPESSESDGDSGDGDSGDGSTAEGEWKAVSIGEISASGTSKLEISDLSTAVSDAGEVTVTPTEDALYTASVTSISLSENWYTATAEVDTSYLTKEKTEDSGQTSANAEGGDTEWDEDKYNSVVNELKGFIAANGTGENKLTKLDSKITGSDLDIGTLTIAKKVTDIDLDDYEVVLGDNDDGDKWDIPEDAETTSITTEAVQHTAVTLDITNSRLRIGEFTQETGTLTIGGETNTGEVSEVIIDSVSKMDGEFTFNGGLLALNANSIDRDELLGFFGKADTANEEAELTTLANTDKLLYIGSTVTFGENARVGFGTSAPTGETLADDDEADDAAQTGSKVVIDAGTTIAFNARVFNSNGLLAGTGDGATLVFNVDPAVDGEKIKLVSENTSVGAFNLTQGFTIADKDGEVLNSDEATGAILDYFDASGVTIDAAWGLNADDYEHPLVYVNDKGQIIIGDTNKDGKVTTADFSLLSDVAAKGLVDDVLAGNRTNETADRYLINRLLMNVHQKKDDSDTIADYSVSEAVREINSMTQFAAVSALKAMTVDFSGYVQDQIEHHAYTIPHEMRGWWVQPIGARLKTDDLRAGNLTTGYSLDTYGIMGGYDWTVPNGDIWGIAASYQSGDADDEGNALAMTSDVSATSFHIWAARHIGDLRVMGAFTYMKSDADATMSTSLGSLSSDELAATALSFGMRADLTKTYGNFKLVPHAGARVSMVDMDDFTVTYQNTYEAFKYSEDKAWIFEVPVGVTAATSFEYQRWNVQPYVDLTVRGRFGDTDATTTVTGVGSGVSDKVKYDVSGDVIGDLRVGYMSTFQNLNLGMSYGFSAGDAGRQNHTFEATLRIDL